MFFEIKKALDSQSLENFIDRYDEKLSNEQMIAIMKEVFREYGLSNKRRKEVFDHVKTIMSLPHDPWLNLKRAKKGQVVKFNGNS